MWWWLWWWWVVVEVGVVMEVGVVVEVVVVVGFPYNRTVAGCALRNYSATDALK